MSPVKKVTPRQIRRAFGGDVSELVEFQEARIQVVLGIIRRGFLGRLKWLLMGR